MINPITNLCRPGPHDKPCGYEPTHDSISTAELTISKWCQCGCSSSGRCKAQNQYVDSFVSEIRFDENKELDEVVIGHPAIDSGKTFFHLERMADDQIWIGVTAPDGKMVHINLWTKSQRGPGKKIYMRAEND